MNLVVMMTTRSFHVNSSGYLETPKRRNWKPPQEISVEAAIVAFANTPGRFWHLDHPTGQYRKYGSYV